MRERRDLERAVDELVGLGGKLGADVIAAAYSTRTAQVRFGRSEITSAGDVETQTVQCTLAFGKRHATVSGSQLDLAALRELAEQCARLARVSPENPEWLPPLGPQKYATAPSGFDPATAGARADLRAAAAGAALERGKKDGLETSGYVEQVATRHFRATSAGMRAYHEETKAALRFTARTADGTGSGWAGAASNRVADLDAAALAEVAAGKAVRSAKPKSLPPGRYTVILEPAAVADVLVEMTDSLSARPADEGRSFFAKPGGGNRVGEKLFGRATLVSDPADVQAGARRWTGDGLPTPATTWIEDGTLRALTTSRFWAQKTGVALRPAPDSWQLAGGKATPEELLAGVDRGLLITRFWYIRGLDPRQLSLTGLTRDGVFLVEKGAIVGPVNNFRFNESPVNMLKNADAFGPAVVTQAGWRTPALRTHDFNFSSVSEAV